VKWCEKPDTTANSMEVIDFAKAIPPSPWFLWWFPESLHSKEKKHDSQCSQALMIIWRFPKIGVPPVLIHFFIGIPWNKPSSVFGVPPWLWKPPYGGFTNTLRIIIVHPISINQWTDISWRVKMPVSCFI
jgi:hypothetical protein